MRRLTDRVQTSVRVQVCGAAQESVLNDLAEASVRFRDLERVDEVHLRLTLSLRDLPTAQNIALRRLCDLREVHRDGLFLRLRPLARRPILILGLLAAIFLTFALQNRVWLIRVEGNERVSSDEILQALSDLGVSFGTRADDISPQSLRDRMLLKIPALSWCTVNRKGGILTVPVTERAVAEPAKPQSAAGHIVALRDGILTQVSVFEGMSLCAPGEAVTKGQLLVSGFEDYGLYLRAVCADAEIYAQTRRAGALVCPAFRQEKVYTGEVWTEYRLTVGNFQRKIGKGSSFLRSDCDRITERKTLRAPDGTALCATLEITTCRAYTLREVEFPESEARTLLSQAWQKFLRAQIVGTVGSTRSRISCDGARYTLFCDSACEEMIAVFLPAEPAYGGNNNGKNNQRRAHRADHQRVRLV